MQMATENLEKRPSFFVLRDDLSERVDTDAKLPSISHPIRGAVSNRLGSSSEIGTAVETLLSGSIPVSRRPPPPSREETAPVFADIEEVSGYSTGDRRDIQTFQKDTNIRTIDTTRSRSSLTMTSAESAQAKFGAISKAHDVEDEIVEDFTPEGESGTFLPMPLSSVFDSRPQQTMKTAKPATSAGSLAAETSSISTSSSRKRLFKGPPSSTDTGPGLLDSEIEETREIIQQQSSSLVTSNVEEPKMKKTRFASNIERVDNLAHLKHVTSFNSLSSAPVRGTETAKWPSTSTLLNSKTQREVAQVTPMKTSKVTTDEYEYWDNLEDLATNLPQEKGYDLNDLSQSSLQFDSFDNDKQFEDSSMGKELSLDENNGAESEAEASVSSHEEDQDEAIALLIQEITQAQTARSNRKRDKNVKRCIESGSAQMNGYIEEWKSRSKLFYESTEGAFRQKVSVMSKELDKEFDAMSNNITAFKEKSTVLKDSWQKFEDASKKTTIKELDKLKSVLKANYAKFEKEVSEHGKTAYSSAKDRLLMKERK